MNDRSPPTGRGTTATGSLRRVAGAEDDGGPGEASALLTLDRRSFTPLYHQLLEALIRQIRRGELQPGDPLPSERELARLYEVSTITARRVMSELVQAGLAERHSGVGSFVSPRALRKRVTLLIFEFSEPARRMIASAFGELVGGIAQAAWEAGAVLGLTYVGSLAELQEWLDHAVETGTNGLLIRAAGDVHAAELDLLDRTGLPYVLVKRHVPGRTVDCVIADEERAVRLVTEHLFTLGHRRIGFVGAMPDTVLYDERYRGYEAALAAAGLRPRPHWVQPGPDFSPEAGRAAAAALLDLPPGERPTALMMASDSMAMGAYEAAAARGLTIPGDVSIAGVDGIAEARTLRPALTTVRMSHHEFGVRATTLLLWRIEQAWRDEPAPPITEVVAPELIMGTSTAAPAP